MGYKREVQAYKLVFEDPQFEGLEVTAKSLALRELFALQGLQEKVATDPAALEKVIRTLADAVVKWNLTDDDDQPVPCDFDGLSGLDMAFVVAIIEAWISAMGGVPKAPLSASSAGGTSLEQSIPMEVS